MPEDDESMKDLFPTTLGEVLKSDRIRPGDVIELQQVGAGIMNGLTLRIRVTVVEVCGGKFWNQGYSGIRGVSLDRLKMYSGEMWYLLNHWPAEG